MNLFNRVLKHEGFESKPYQCSEGVMTFGHGLTYITEDESKVIVQGRLIELNRRLLRELPFFSDLPLVVRDVLIEMAYQLGVAGTLKFKKALAAMESGDFDRAADEMLDSRWFDQTPSRAQALADIVRAA